MIRKAMAEDLPAILEIYNEVHDREEAGEVTTGWLRGIYPVQKTAEDSLVRGGLYVQTDAAGCVVGTGIINRIQMDVYAKGSWEHPAEDKEIMVLHTLLISGNAEHQGLGTEFLKFYEDYARECDCTCLRLDTNARNKAARAFYGKNGYTEIGTVPTVFNGIPGVDLVLLEKKLGGK